jgi:hypothetical protein
VFTARYELGLRYSIVLKSSMTAHFEANITNSKREHTKPLFYALVVFVKNERK